MSIATNCMLVNVTMGKWDAQKGDAMASDEVADRKGAVRGAARVNKHLIDKETLKPVITAYNDIRTHFYAKTLPWRDKGDRLLSRKMYQSFIEEHERLVGKFQVEVNNFADVSYPRAMAKAEFRMGALFNPDDYPTPDNVRKRFYANLEIDAVSEAGDFRVALDQEAVAAIQTQIESAMNARLGRAMADVWDRLSTTLTHFCSKLGDEEAVFRDTTITNLQELVNMLPGLNITDDPNLKRVGRELRQLIGGYTAKELRKDTDVRNNVVAEAQRIAEEMAGFCRAFQWQE